MLVAASVSTGSLGAKSVSNGALSAASPSPGSLTAKSISNGTLSSSGNSTGSIDNIFSILTDESDVVLLLETDEEISE
jgi:hypothetical protein